ncbi:uncharacterized protein [Macrobrachium rosenbergii]|uniref:uncharacterized protein isoform X2 n=1 Tax=Macrobrachium rosenbergii TaxID=79674 RepID=UPI0034D6EFDA
MNRDDVYTVVGRYSKVYLFLSLVLLEISGFGHYSNVDPYMKNDFWEGVENSRFGINRMILKDLKRTAIGHNEAGDSTDGVGCLIMLQERRGKNEMLSIQTPSLTRWHSSGF